MGNHKILFDLGKIIKNNTEIKVIILPNYLFPQYLKKHEELGADYFIYKISEFIRIPEILRKYKTKQTISRAK